MLSIGALDQFVHEFTRVEMVQIHQQLKSRTDSFDRFKVRISAVQQAISDVGNTNWLDQEIRHAHSWLSFQRPERIAEAIRLISTVNLWDEIAALRNEDANTTKTQLRAIVDRRDKIVHEADLDPTSPGLRWPISANAVEGALEFVDSIAHGIHDVYIASN